MSREDRMKASDVHRYHPLAQTGTFSDVFPEVKSVRMTVSEEGHLTLGRYSYEPKVRVYTEKQFPEYADCSNPKCYNGGVQIAQILREMVLDKKTHLETGKACQGYEGSPKGKRRYGKCVNFFKITADAEYNL